jgi:hypothetical protein
MFNNDLFTQLPIALPQAEFLAFCQKWGIEAAWLFGSVLREDFRPESSDIDMLVSFDPNYRHNLWDWATMGDELETLFGRKVDFGSRKAIESDENYLRRQYILGSIRVIYAA